MQEKDFNSAEDYQASLEKISHNFHHHTITNFDRSYEEMPQNYHELAGQIWSQLNNAEEPEEVLSLLAKLNLDIDGFAWLNDQYELAIVSAIAKQKKINEMLNNQVQKLKQGQ